MMMKLNVKTLDEMKKFAEVVAEIIEINPGVIFLDGDLGAGKTTFTKFFAAKIGVNDIVTSPTFNIFKRYSTNTGYLNHFDLYRIKEDVYDQGFEDYWFSKDISIIEWSTYLPVDYKKMLILHLLIEIDGSNRIVDISGNEKIINLIKEKYHEFIY